MLGDEGTDRSVGVVDGDIEGSLSYDGDALTGNRINMSVVVYIFDEGDTPGGDGGEVDDVDAGA